MIFYPMRWEDDMSIVYIYTSCSKHNTNTIKYPDQEISRIHGVFDGICFIFLEFTCNTVFFGTYPLINVYITIENHHRTSEFSHETWGFSIAIWLFTRGYVSKEWQLWPTAGVLHPDLNLGDQKINHTLW